MRISFLISILILLPQWVGGQVHEVLPKEVDLIKRTVLTNTAYCSDGSDRARDGKPRFHGPMVARITSLNGFQYVSYYEANGNIIVARNKMGEEHWEKLILPGYRMTSQDRHNKIAMAISKADGVIHLSFDHHNSETFHYAKSVVGLANHPERFKWQSELFALQPNLGLTEKFGLITYPSFYDIEDTGGLLMYWRTGGAIKGEMNLARYDPLDGKWFFIGEISSSEGMYNKTKGTRGPYHAGFVSDSQGNIHVGWLWREDPKQRIIKNNIGNHGISYASSSNGGKIWTSNNGNTVADVELGSRMSIDDPGSIPISVPMELDPTNVGFTSIYDEKNKNLIFMISHLNDEKEERFNFLYIKDQKGNWKKYSTGLKNGGEMVTLGDRLVVCNSDGIFYSKKADDYKDWKHIKFPFKLRSGSIQWDLSEVEKGNLNFVIQYDPKKIGQPTPVEVFELKM